MSMQTFSFRAECIEDVKSFRTALDKAGVIYVITVSDDADFPDVEVELSAEVTLEQLRGLMRAVVDGHVMLQTLRPCVLADNSLERDYELQ
jgi:hypothetical protein